MPEELGALPWDSGYGVSLTETCHPPLRISDDSRNEDVITSALPVSWRGSQGPADRSETGLQSGCSDNFGIRVSLKNTEI